MNRRRKTGSGSRSALWTMVTVLLLVLTACDAGKAPYDEAVTLEEQGKLAEAADKYDAVCRRAPDSKLCPTATSRAAAVRLKLAQQDIDAMKFTDADAALKTVVESGDSEAKGKAKAKLDSKELLAGLLYQKALANTDKHTAMSGMESVGASGTPVAPKATEWLAKERPALLLADATSACGSKPPTPCPTICDRLAKLHPGTPEAAKAADLLSAYQRADADRLYPLLTQAESLMAQCQAYWRSNEAHSRCILQQMAATGDGLAALVACGEADQKTEEKLSAAFDKATADIATQSVVDPLKTRFTASCKEGEYERQTIPKPARAASAAATPAKGKLTCPDGRPFNGPTRAGCYCGEELMIPCPTLVTRVGWDGVKQ